MPFVREVLISADRIMQRFRFGFRVLKIKIKVKKLVVAGFMRVDQCKIILSDFTMHTPPLKLLTFTPTSFIDKFSLVDKCN